MLCDIAYVMQLEQRERRLLPVVAGLVSRVQQAEHFEFALSFVERELERFDRDLIGAEEVPAPSGLDHLYREAGIV